MSVGTVAPTYPAPDAAPASTHTEAGPSIRGWATGRQPGLAVWVGVAVVGLAIVCALLAPWLAPYPPLRQDLDARSVTPRPGHWLGTDELGRDVLSRLIFGTPISLLMAFGAVIGVPLAFAAAAQPGSPWAFLATLLSTMTVAAPGFAIAIGGLMVFAFCLRWLPATQSPVLPGAVLGLDVAGTLVRFIRAELEVQLSADYVRTALAMGQGRQAILSRHVARNALIQGITVFGLAFGNLLTGATIAETIFDWPGIGLLAIDAIRVRDYPVIQGTILFMAPAFVVVNVLTDLLYSAADPRIRLN